MKHHKNLDLNVKVKTDESKSWPMMTLSVKMRGLNVTNVKWDCHGRTPLYVYVCKTILPSHSYFFKVKANASRSNCHCHNRLNLVLKMRLLGLFYTQNNSSQHEMDKMSAQAAHKKDTISNADLLDYMPLQDKTSLTWQQRAWHDACHSSVCYVSLSVRGAILIGGFGSFACKFVTSEWLINSFMYHILY